MIEDNELEMMENMANTFGGSCNFNSAIVIRLIQDLKEMKRRNSHQSEMMGKYAYALKGLRDVVDKLIEYKCHIAASDLSATGRLGLLGIIQHYAQLTNDIISQDPKVD